MNTYGGVDVEIHVFLISAWLEVSGQLQGTAALLPAKESPSTNCIGGWMGPRASLDDMKT
jgi:hypothetical protein